MSHPEPERWVWLMRSLTVGGVRWDPAADALESLIAADMIERALILGWDARELIGLQRFRPYDHPLRAGLIFSLRPGDAVRDVSRAGCVIAYGKVRHIWRRTPLDASTLLPWDLAELLGTPGSPFK
jgi:hypothetical protein